jgi:hypothetical protein
MRVLIYSTGEDTGGVGIGIVNAFRRHAPDWDVRFVRRTDNYIHYPADIDWRTGDDETEELVRDLYRKADVIHSFRNWAVLDGWESKGKVIHHHGRQFRASPEMWIEQGARYHAVSICSTLDLAAYSPELVWIPNPYNLDWLAEQRRQPSGTVKVAHAPTGRGGKSTDAFLAQASSLPLQVELIERVPWQECLLRKSDADIYYDQIFVGYGNNATEAWGMGIPVVAGVNAEAAVAAGHPIPLDTRDRMLDRWGQMPFLEADASSIGRALEVMLDPDCRAEYAQRGLEHVRRWHDDAVVVEMLKEVYDRAVA